MQARKFDDYHQALIVSLDEEISGEAYFARLAEYHSGHARRALKLLAEMESVTAAAIAPLLAEHGLRGGDRQELQHSGRAEADVQKSVSWQARVSAMVADFPAFVEEFKQIELLAPPADLETVAFVTQHEVAAVEFAMREAASRADSLTPLEDFLASIDKLNNADDRI